MTRQEVLERTQALKFTIEKAICEYLGVVDWPAIKHGGFLPFDVAVMAYQVDHLLFHVGAMMAHRNTDAGN